MTDVKKLFADLAVVTIVTSLSCFSLHAKVMPSMGVFFLDLLTFVSTSANETAVRNTSTWLDDYFSCSKLSISVRESPRLQSIRYALGAGGRRTDS